MNTTTCQENFIGHHISGIILIWWHLEKCVVFLYRYKAVQLAFHCKLKNNTFKSNVASLNDFKAFKSVSSVDTFMFLYLSSTLLIFWIYFNLNNEQVIMTSKACSISFDSRIGSKGLRNLNSWFFMIHGKPRIVVEQFHHL